jgi:hypothetical protein
LQILSNRFGSNQPDLLSEDFQFSSPIIGPLNKKDFLQSADSLFSSYDGLIPKNRILNLILLLFKKQNKTILIFSSS